MNRTSIYIDRNKLSGFFTQFVSVKDKLSKDSFFEMGWVLTGQFINVLLNFVIIKQLSLLGTSGYGIYALILTINLLVGSVYYGPVTQSFLRFFYHYKDRGNSEVFVGLMYRFLLYSAAVLILCGFITAAIAHAVMPSFTLFLITFFIIVLKTNDFFSISLNLIRKRKHNSILQITEKGLNVIMLWLLYKNNLLTINSVLFVFILSAFLLLMIKFVLFNRFTSVNSGNSAADPGLIKTEIKKTLLAYAVPFLIWGFFGWLQSNSEKWIIARFLSTSDVGIYALMMTLINALIILPNNIITDFSTPIIFQYFSDIKNNERIKTGHIFIKLIIVFVAFLTVFSSTLTYFFGYSLIRIISSGAFASFWYLLPAFCIGTGLFYTGQAMCTLGMALNMPGKYIIPKIITGVFSVVMNIILINLFGLKGISYSLLITGALLFGLYLYGQQKNNRRNICQMNPFKLPENVKKSGCNYDAA